MELFVPGYRVTQILEETGDKLKKIDLSDTKTCQELTKLFINAKGRRREDAKKEGRVPLVGKCILIEVDSDSNLTGMILFDERNTPDRKNKVSIPGGHVEDIDIDLTPHDRGFHNILHATLFREIMEELSGESTFDDISEDIFRHQYNGSSMSVLPGLLNMYGLVDRQFLYGEPDIYYQLTREYESETGVPFLIFYVPIYVYGELSNVEKPAFAINSDWYRKHCFISFSRHDYNFIDHIKRSSNDKQSPFICEYDIPAKSDVRIMNDNIPQSRMLPAIFNTEEIWNPIK